MCAMCILLQYKWGRIESQAILNNKWMIHCSPLWILWAMVGLYNALYHGGVLNLWWWEFNVGGSTVVPLVMVEHGREAGWWGKTPRFLFSSASILQHHQPIGHPSQSLHPSPSLHTISPPISISNFSFSSKCICPKYKMFLSKLQNLNI